MSEKAVLFEKIEGGVGIVTLNEPKKKNAMTAALLKDLHETMFMVEMDPEVKCIILKGAGGCFCAGGDLVGSSGGDVRDTMVLIESTIAQLQQCDKPIIAMVEGFAIGGGCSYAVNCDLIVATDTAKFAFNFMKLGLAPEMGSMAILPQMVGVHKAKELFLTGRRFSAQEAQEMGMVSFIYTADEILEKTIALAKEIADMPPASTRTMKRVVNAIAYPNMNLVLTADISNTPYFLTRPETMEYIAKNFAAGKKK